MAPQLKGLCVCVCVISEELRQLLTHNELQIRAIQTLWEQHLQEALKDWEQQYASITQVGWRMSARSLAPPR